MEISSEQQAIMECVFEDKNILVNAVPGAGKTTTILHLAENTNKRIICVTLSKRLKEESVKRLNGRFKNIFFYTIHGFILKTYKKPESETSIEDNPEINICCDIFIIDECQDLSIKFLVLIKKVIREINPLIIVLGDHRQRIFENYKKIMSDSRVLTMADKIHDTDRDWTYMPLSQSFRLSIQNATFMNRVILKTNGQYIRSFKEGYKPRYVVCRERDRNNVIIDEIKRYLNMGYTPNDIFVICPTVTKYDGNLELMDKLSRQGHLIYCTHKEVDYCEEAARNKINFITLHSSKGLERKVVIFTCFDESYYLCFDNNSRVTCPNLIYVALTRVIDRLTLIRNCEKRKLPFTDESNIHEYADVINGSLLGNCDPSHCVRRKPREIFVTELLEANNNNTIKKILKTIHRRRICRNMEKINISETAYNNQTNTFEQVSNISGVGIISYYEYITTGTMSIKKDIKPENFTISNVLRYSSEFISKINRLHFIDRQINKTNWISEEEMNRCIERLSSCMETLEISDNQGEYEIQNEREITVENERYLLIGKLDFIHYDKQIIIEFKCVNELSPESFIQVMLYAYIFNINYDLYVFNVLTNDLIKIEYDFNSLHQIAIELIENMDKNESVSEREFLRRCNSY